MLHRQYGDAHRVSLRNHKRVTPPPGAYPETYFNLLRNRVEQSPPYWLYAITFAIGENGWRTVGSYPSRVRLTHGYVNTPQPTIPIVTADLALAMVQFPEIRFRVVELPCSLSRQDCWIEFPIDVPESLLIEAAAAEKYLRSRERYRAKHDITVDYVQGL